jgi:nitrite reductase (NO-forming)
MGISTTSFELIRGISWVLFLIILISGYFYLRRPGENKKKTVVSFVVILILLSLVGIFAGKVTTGHLSLYFFGKAQGPFEYGPELPFLSSFKFLSHVNEFEKIDDIGYDPRDIPPPINRDYPEHVTIDLEAIEVLAEITEGTTFNYWTFNRRVPGPALRVRVGDTITVNLKNVMSSLHTHSVDFHATTGPGGGSMVLQVPPGETKSLTWKALSPGVFIYHCASKHSVAAHMAHGQYGLIIVEPEEGLPLVDKEFYIVQGEFYTRGNTGDKGLVAFDSRAMLDENPNYVVFNGRVNSLNEKMNAEVGDRVRLYVGNGGVSKVSSFHVIGELFDRVYPEGSISEDLHVHENVQTTIIPAGGATIVEFDLEIPGTNILVDHSLSRMDKGAWGLLEVAGEDNPDVFFPHNP